jgi:hypothetical protein
MIVVKVELHSALTGKVSEIGRMHIFNVASGTRTRRDYGVKVFRRGTLDRVQKTGEIKAHPSLSASVWTLVRKALQSVAL